MGWTCAKVRRRLALWVGGDLPAHQQAAVSRHLQKCPACRPEAAGLRRAHAALLRCRRPGASALPPVWPVVQQCLPQAAPARRYRRWWLPGAALSAAALLLLAVVLWLWLGPTPEPALPLGPVAPLTARPLPPRIELPEPDRWPPAHYQWILHDGPQYQYHWILQEGLPAQSDFFLPVAQPADHSIDL